MSSELQVSSLLKYFVDLKIFNAKGNLGTEWRLANYLKFLFDGIEITGKKVLDIGAGFGIYSSYMASQGAFQVLSVEPEMDGGSQKMISTIEKIKERFSLQNISIQRDTFQNFKTNDQYDVILLHNCINHLNEDSCINFKRDPDARSEYLNYFKKIFHLLNKNGVVIITDSSRNNLFGDLRVKNPIAPSVEYEKHQNARTWASLAKQAGFKISSIEYTPLLVLGKPGIILTSNRLVSYLGLSAFKLVLTK